MNYNNCPCTAVGKDGTTLHNESSNKRVSNDYCSLVPCKNHIDEYLKYWVNPKVEDLMVRTQVTKETIAKSIAHANEALSQLTKKFTDFSLNEDAKSVSLNTKRSPQERQLRGVLKHIAKYGKDTALHTFAVRSFSVWNKVYLVKQMLVGPWICDCPDYNFSSVEKKENGYECKHIVRAKNDSKNAMDIAYGQGAIEAHSRLTGIAKNALGEPKEHKEPTGLFIIEFPSLGTNSSWYRSSNHKETYTYSQAKEIIANGSKVDGISDYRMSPVEPLVEDEYKIECKIYNSDRWKSSARFKIPMSKKEAQKILDEADGSVMYRMVPIKSVTKGTNCGYSAIAKSEPKYKVQFYKSASKKYKDSVTPGNGTFTAAQADALIARKTKDTNLKYRKVVVA